jgi:hypothetical protein
MIVEFNIMRIDDRFFAVAIMNDGPVIEIGLFDEFDDAELACARFRLEYDRRLH